MGDHWRKPVDRVATITELRRDGARLSIALLAVEPFSPKPVETALSYFERLVGELDDLL